MVFHGGWWKSHVNETYQKSEKQKFEIRKFRISRIYLSIKNCIALIATQHRVTPSISPPCKVHLFSFSILLSISHAIITLCIQTVRFHWTALLRTPRSIVVMHSLILVLSSQPFPLSCPLHLHFLSSWTIIEVNLIVFQLCYQMITPLRRIGISSRTLLANALPRLSTPIKYSTTTSTIQSLSIPNTPRTFTKSKDYEEMILQDEQKKVEYKKIGVQFTEEQLNAEADKILSSIHWHQLLPPPYFYLNINT